MQDYKSENIFFEFYDRNADWDFTFSQLPRTGTRWYEQFGKRNNFKIQSNSLNSSPKKSRLILPSNDEVPILLAPNGFLSTKLNK